MKVLLTNSPLQLVSKPKHPSFGIAYIAQELKRYNYGVEILDIDAQRYSKAEVIEQVKNSKADIIGIGGFVSIYSYLDWLIPQIKKIKPKIEIILGGIIATALKEKCFARFAIDYEVIGEGEITIIELLRELDTNRNLDTVKGVGFRSNGKIVFTERRPLMPSLDNLPIFDDTLFPVDKFLQNSGGAFPLHVQRGCPFSCTFSQKICDNVTRNG